MSTATTVPNWRRMPPVPRSLQRLFDSVPLLTYEANELPARAQASTSSQIPILYVFSSSEDAQNGLPSFNPGCLKWQTFLKLSNLPFNILPSTNHASPTGSLPFLLPPRDALSPTTTPVKPIPASKLHDYALAHAHTSKSEPPSPPVPPPRQEAYQSLLDVSLRNAFLYTLYLDTRYSSLLDKLYIHPSTSSTWIQATLRHQLRRAAEAEILKTTRAASGGGGGVHGVVDPEEVYRNAREALEALASELKGSEGGWFFGGEEPGVFDAGVFAYVYLMRKLFVRGEEETRLGDLVGRAGDGELIGHMERVLGLTWPGLVSGKEGGL